MQDDDGLWRGEDALVLLEEGEDDLTHTLVVFVVPLGMKTALLSGVRTSVWKRRTARTVPSTPWAEMKSPMPKGFVTMMMTPPAKFCSCPLSAIPTAKPIEAKTAAKDTDLTPRMLAKMIPKVT